MGTILAYLSNARSNLIIGCVVLVIILSAWLYIDHLNARIDTAEHALSVTKDSLDQQIAVNQQNIQTLAILKDQYNRDIMALSADGAANAERVKSSTHLKEEIIHVKPSDDGPVANVLSRTLDGLRRRKNSPASSVQLGEAADTHTVITVWN